MVLHTRPVGQPGVYKTRKEFAAAIEAEAGSYQGRQGELIVVHQEAQVSEENSDTVKAADTYFVAHKDITPAHNW